MMIFRILSLLSALAATGYSLSCSQCIATSPSVCSGTSMTCAPGFVCGSILSETRIDEDVVQVLVRRCVAQYECDFQGTSALYVARLRQAIKCCSTDDCTPPLPTLLPRSNEPNGLMCQSCASYDTISCDSSETMNCTGNEKRCLLMTEQTTSESGDFSSVYAFRGCATQSYCDFGIVSNNDTGMITKTNYLCTSDGISVQKVVLTPAGVCLLLLKWLI